MSSIRLSMTRFLAVARGETNLALAGAPRVARRLFGIAGWALLAILSGAIVGFAAVVLPPMGLVGIVAIFALFLLWALPDGFEPPDKFMKWLLLIVVFVHICIPSYYSIAIPGLPWISIRRLFAVILILLFALAYSSSPASRKQISGIINDNKLICTFVLGYLIMMVASIFFARNPFGPLSAMIDVLLEWYVPFICTIYVLRDVEDVEKLLRLLCWCAIITAIVGIIEFKIKKNVYISIMPRFMYDSLVQTDFGRGLLTGGMSSRNGEVRASGPYSVALSFAEFQAMVSAFGTVFLVHGRSLWDRIFGGTVLVACLGAIFVSGSRGGYLAFLVANFAFVALVVARSRLFQPRSLAAPIFAILGAAGGVVVACAILFIGRLHSLIFGGGAGDMSNQARIEEWNMAWPKILANPVTGHGFGIGGDIIGYRSSPGAPLSVDSFLLSLVVETGVPSVIFFFGTALAAIWVAAKQYLSDRDRGGIWAGGLACSITAYTAYRFFLSQRENQTLFYVLVGCVAILHSFNARKVALEPPISRD